MQTPTTDPGLRTTKFLARFGGRFLCRSPPAGWCRVGSPNPTESGGEREKTAGFGDPGCNFTIHAAGNAYALTLMK